MADKWFNDKFEKRNLRKYTSKRLNENRPFNKLARKFTITNWLIIANVAVYLFIIILKIGGTTEQQIFNIFALQGNTLFNGAYWTILTSMFTHIWLPHLFFNMISLFFIGSFLEKLIGRRKFLWFYLLSGIFAGIFAGILSFYFGNSELGAKIFIDPNIYGVGASGAIFGIAGLLAMLTPRMKVYLIAGPIIAIIFQSIITKIIPNSPYLSLINFAVMFYIFFAIFTMFSFNPKTRRLSFPIAMPFYMLPIIAIVPLVIVGLFVDLPIGNTAHLGGLLAGLAYGYHLKNKYKRKSALIRKRFS
jgi:membrane associated rhomboid family serine protease